MSERRARAIVPVRILVGLVALSLFGPALATPWMTSRGWTMGAWVVRQFFSPVCHQDIMRSFWFWGAPAAVCARCLGIDLGAAVGVLARVERRLAMWAFAIMLLVNCADVLAEFVGWHGNLPQVRFTLGILLGVTVSAVVVSAAQFKNPTQATSA